MGIVDAIGMTVEIGIGFVEMIGMSGDDEEGNCISIGNIQVYPKHLAYEIWTRESIDPISVYIYNSCLPWIVLKLLDPPTGGAHRASSDVDWSGLTLRAKLGLPLVPQ